MTFVSYFTTTLPAAAPVGEYNNMSMMHVYLSEKFAKLSSFNETLQKVLEEKTNQLAEKSKEASEKTRELTQLQQKVANEYEKVPSLSPFSLLSPPPSLFPTIN
jgi:hypothetical protein